MIAAFIFVTSLFQISLKFTESIYSYIIPRLLKSNESELKIWNDEVSSAMDKGFFFIGLPMHVAVGTKK